MQKTAMLHRTGDMYTITLTATRTDAADPGWISICLTRFPDGWSHRTMGNWKENG